MKVFQRNYRWWKKIMGLGRIMEDKNIIFVRQIREDLVDKQTKIMVFQRNYGWWKKNDGFGTNYGR